MDSVNVMMGGRVVKFGDERLKSDLYRTTRLSSEQVDKVVLAVKRKLAVRDQPVLPHDIATATHVVLIEMGLTQAAEGYYSDVKERFDGRGVPKEKITFVNCAHCGTSNDLNAKYCIGCGAPVNKTGAKSKII